MAQPRRPRVPALGPLMTKTHVTDANETCSHCPSHTGRWNPEGSETRMGTEATAAMRPRLPRKTPSSKSHVCLLYVITCRRGRLTGTDKLTRKQGAGGERLNTQRKWNPQKKEVPCRHLTNRVNSSFGFHSFMGDGWRGSQARACPGWEVSRRSPASSWGRAPRMLSVRINEK